MEAMLLDEKKTIQRIVENYLRTGSLSDEQVKVTLLPDKKTSYVEQFANNESRSILLDEYRMDNKVMWAGYSTRTGTVYMSSAPGV